MSAITRIWDWLPTLIPIDGAHEDSSMQRATLQFSRRLMLWIDHAMFKIASVRRRRYNTGHPQTNSLTRLKMQQESDQLCLGQTGRLRYLDVHNVEGNVLFCVMESYIRNIGFTLVDCNNVH